MAIADELIALLGFELTGEDAARRYESTLKRVEKTAERVGNAIGRSIRIGALAATAGFTLLTRSVIGVNAQFESFETTLVTIEGSSEKAKQSMGWIAGFAKTTPYDVGQVTAAFIKLKAYGIDPLADDALRTLGDTASAMGKDLNQAVEALADAQTGEFERLKEFGIKARQEGDNVTFAWSKNGEELTKTVKKSAVEIRTFLLETMGERFTGAMDRQSRTWNGMMSNLGDTWTSFQRKIGDAGFFTHISERLSGLLAHLDELEANGTLDEWATNISNVMTTVANVIEAIATRIGENVAFLIENWDSLQGTVTGLAVAIGWLAMRAFPIASIFILAGLAIDDFLAYLQGGESTIGNFISWIQETTGASKELAQVLAAIVGSLGLILGMAAVFKPVALLKGIGKAAGGILGMGAGAAVGAGAGAGVGAGAAAGAGAAGAGLMGWVKGIASAAGMASIATLITSLGDTPGDTFEDQVQNQKEYREQLESIIGGIGDTLNTFRSNVQSMFAPAGPTAEQAARAGALIGGAAPPPGGGWGKMLQNYGAHQAAQQGAEAAVVNQTDARVISQTNNVTVNQTVTQPSNAPSAAANATGQAVKGAVADQRSQIETEPSF